MANPQKENGFTPIANEIMEAVAKLNLTPTGYKILFVIWRQTYGFNRIQYGLSDSFIAKATDAHPKLINREVNRLIERRILTLYKSGTYTKPRQIGFNKDYDSWINDYQPNKGYQLNSGYQSNSRKGTNQMVDRVPTKQLPKERQYKENNKDIYKESVLRHWNDQKIIVHKSLSNSISKALDKALKENSHEEINTAISRYSTMLKDESYTWCSYVWGLDTFLTRQKGYKAFLDDGEKWLSYQSQLKPSRSPKGKTEPGSQIPLGTELPPWIEERI